ncbi:MAG TPA: cytochrome C, partial [Pseudomonadales bacterium]|nr:cytochrome C [Pseudomonadales bacterium]
MKSIKFLLAQVIAGALVLSAFTAQAEMRFPVNNKQPVEGEYVHVPPTMEDLETADLHPELKRVIRRGYDLFMNTQQLRGENVF